MDWEDARAEWMKECVARRRRRPHAHFKFPPRTDPASRGSVCRYVLGSTKSKEDKWKKLASDEEARCVGRDAARALPSVR